MEFKIIEITVLNNSRMLRYRIIDFEKLKKW